MSEYITEEVVSWAMVVIGSVGLLAVLVIEGVKGRRSPSIHWGDRK